MGKLRNTVKSQFLRILDESSFTAEDFELEFGDPADGEHIVTIHFIHEASFIFNFYDNAFGTFHVTRSPGDVHEEETKHVKKFDDVFDEVISWTQEIRAELEASQPIYRDIGNLREVIKEAIFSSVTNEEEFTVDEINNLRKKFGELEKRVSDLEQNKIITEKQKNDFSEGLSVVSDNLEKLPKQTWLKTSVNKLTKTLSIIAKSREGRKLLADGTRKLLGMD